MQILSTLLQCFVTGLFTAISLIVIDVYIIGPVEDKESEK